MALKGREVGRREYQRELINRFHRMEDALPSRMKEKKKKQKERKKRKKEERRALMSPACFDRGRFITAARVNTIKRDRSESSKAGTRTRREQKRPSNQLISTIPYGSERNGQDFERTN